MRLGWNILFIEETSCSRNNDVSSLVVEKEVLLMVLRLWDVLSIVFYTSEKQRLRTGRRTDL